MERGCRYILGGVLAKAKLSYSTRVGIKSYTNPRERHAACRSNYTFRYCMLACSIIYIDTRERSNKNHLKVSFRTVSNLSRPSNVYQWECNQAIGSAVLVRSREIRIVQAGCTSDPS